MEWEPVQMDEAGGRKQLNKSASCGFLQSTFIMLV